MKLEHGHFDIHIEGDIIYTKLYGAFNEHGVIAWANAMKDTIRSLNGNPFSILVDELDAYGATPEALNEGEKYNQWLNHQKLQAKAVVYSSDMLRDIDIKNLPARAYQNIEFFNDVQQAQHWLMSQQTEATGQ